MSEELNALVEKVARAMCCGDAACFYESSGCACLVKDNSGFQRQAIAAIRAVAEATREASEAMQRDGNRALVSWIAPAMHSAEAWRAMHDASPLGEALRDAE